MCRVGLEGHRLSKQIEHLGNCAPEYDLMSSLGYALGPLVSRQVLPLFVLFFFAGSITHRRLLASALRAHHLHGDGKWCPKHMTSPCGYAKECAGAGSFGGLMSLVGIRNPLDPMPVSVSPGPQRGCTSPT